MKRHYRTAMMWALVSAFAVATPASELRAQGGEAGQTTGGDNEGFNDWGLLGLLGLLGLMPKKRDDHTTTRRP